MIRPNRRNTIAILIVCALVAACVTCYLLSLVPADDLEMSLSERLGITEPSGEFRLWINSFPEGAEVLLDDSLVGQTPLALVELPAGQYLLSLHSERFHAVDTVVLVSDEGSVELPLFVLQRTIRFESTPSGAAVSLNGKEQSGVTPIEIRQPSSDTFFVSYAHPDLGGIWLSAVDPSDGTAIVPLGQRWETDNGDPWVLHGLFSKVCTLRTVPTSAYIYLQETDSLLGLTGKPIELPCGMREYVLTKDDFNTLTIEFDACAEGAWDNLFELTHALRVSAVSFEAPEGDDIGAMITTLQSGSIVESVNERTPADIELRGVEYRLCLQADGFVDTCVVISASQTLIKVKMKRRGLAPDLSGAVPGSGAERVEFLVCDKRSKSGLSGAEVIARFKSENRTVLLGVTDSAGYLAVDLVPGKYEFRFVKEGYKQVRKKHTVKRGQTKLFDILLKTN